VPPPSEGIRPIDEVLARPRDRTPRLFVIDVDGTLLTSTHEVSPRTVAEVARVRSRGVEVLLASSRGPGVLEPVLRAVDLATSTVFVASQGALTGRYLTDGRLEVIDRRPIPVDLIRPVLEAAAREGIAVSWYAGADWFVSHVDPTIVLEAEIVGVEPAVRDLFSEATGPEKVMLIAPSADLTPLAAIAADLPAGLRAQVSNPTYLEITRADVDKAEAVRRYCDEHAIPTADVIAMGDGPNDLGLFALAGTSVAPASARPEVLKAATFVTAGNDEDGVALALRALLP
jgi:Cof subfamily protein (haloacid dehalogenase superfamily)